MNTCRQIFHQVNSPGFRLHPIRSACLLLSVLIFSSGFLTLNAQQKYKSYFFQGDLVVFEFDMRTYQQAQALDSLKRLDFEDLDIQSVAVTGDFNNWSKKGWRMKKTGPYTYQLQKRIEDFDDKLTWEFKFLINGQYVVDPNTAGAEQKIIPVDIWEEVYHLDVYNVHPVEKGNAVFFLDGYQEARKVILTGSFNGWNEHSLAMTKVDGGWRMHLELPHGRYEYKFIVDGEWTHDLANKKTVHNEHGTLNSVLDLTKSVTFTLTGHLDAKQVALAGSFNDWQTNQMYMKRVHAGWSITLEMTPGKHYYKFIVDGAWIIDPHNPLSEFDGEGNLNSILLVQ